MLALLFAPVPGSSKRAEPVYEFRLVYQGSGHCLQVWQVTGGKDFYQASLEQDIEGHFRWHCSCADSAYRGERIAGHVCKHVRTLLAFLAPPGRAG